MGAIIGILLCVIILAYTSTKIHNKIQNNNIDKKCQQLTNETREEQEAVDVEKRYLDDISIKINEIVAQFKSSPVSFSIETLLKRNSYHFNQGTIMLIRGYEERVSAITSKIEKIDLQINEILECREIAELKSRLEYLQSKEQALTELKSERDNLYIEIETLKTNLTDFLQSEELKSQNIQKQLKVILLKYRPKEVDITNLPISTINLDVDAAYTRQDVIDVVVSYTTRINEMLNKIQKINNKINNTLNHVLSEELESLEEKLAYLSSKKEELDKLKNEGELLYKCVQTFHIKLINENNDYYELLHKSFTSLRDSEKCVSSGGCRIKTFISKKFPQGLSFFAFENNPIVLFLDNKYYCLFCNVILVFDRNGAFISALDPSVIQIGLETKRVSINCFNGSYSPHRFIGTDSKCFRRGELKTTWRYTCMDGTPDHRYKDNHRYWSHTDVYEYVVITITIFDKVAKYSASSRYVKENFRKLIPLLTSPASCDIVCVTEGDTNG